MAGGGRDGLAFVVWQGARRERCFMHRDRRRDADQAAKDRPPLRGRPERPAGGVECLDRAAWPGLRTSPSQPASPADPGHLRPWVRTLMGGLAIEAKGLVKS